MIALVTGGSGYFGSSLIEKLLTAGWICKSLDINVPDNDGEGVEFIKADIRDYSSVLNACKGVDVVFHNVAQVPLAKDKHLFESVNINGTINVLDSAIEAGVKKIIYTSSSAVFGVPKTNPVDESVLPNPMESYGHAKYIGEQKCLEYTKKGLDVDIIRPRTIMGHGRLGIFQILFEWIRTGNNIPVLGLGDNIYQFVHADDLAEVTIKAATKAGSEIYNCGTDRYGSMREVLENLCAYAQTGSRVVSVPFKPVVAAMDLFSFLGLSPLGAYHSLMYGRSMYFDISKAKNNLQWQPQYSNNEMFIESYNWYVNNISEVSSYHSGKSHHKSGVNQGILKLVKWIL
jgi:nucleoside-diphosphate-sugar epimerase